MTDLRPADTARWVCVLCEVSLAEQDSVYCRWCQEELAEAAEQSDGYRSESGVTSVQNEDAP